MRSTIRLRRLWKPSRSLQCPTITPSCRTLSLLLLRAPSVIPPSISTPRVRTDRPTTSTSTGTSATASTSMTMSSRSRYTTATTTTTTGMPQSATPSTHNHDNNVTIVEQSTYLLSLMTILRSAETDSKEFASCVHKVARLVVSSGNLCLFLPIARVLVLFAF